MSGLLEDLNACGVGPIVEDGAEVVSVRICYRFQPPYTFFVFRLESSRKSGHAYA